MQHGAKFPTQENHTTNKLSIMPDDTPLQLYRKIVAALHHVSTITVQVRHQVYRLFSPWGRPSRTTTSVTSITIVVPWWWIRRPSVHVGIIVARWWWVIHASSGRSIVIATIISVTTVIISIQGNKKKSTQS